MPPLTRRFLLLASAAGLAIPAIAQVQEAAPPAPATTQPAPATPAPAPTPSPSPAPAVSRPSTAVVDDVVEQDVTLEPPPPPVEYPDFAQRNPFVTGALDPASAGLGTDPWGQARGAFLETLMRRMKTPVASRWAHIGLRNAMLASARAPRGINPVDWAAERAWLLLRLGEADAAELVIASVDTDKFTPKMAQVAVQSALANSDPLALCPVSDSVQKAEPRVTALVQAICAGLNGEPERAKALIESARRRGTVGGIDLALAQKVVGATADTGTAATIEWEPVQALTAWRYGLATATAMSPPERLMTDAPTQVRAWYATAPMIPLRDRLESARIATGLGVLSSQALTDFYAWIYDATDPNELSGSDGWQLRLAYAATDQASRLSAMRRLWKLGESRVLKESSRALLARASARIAPSTELQDEAPELIASMLAAGMDREAARWKDAVAGMDDEQADQSWAMLALGAPEGSVDVSAARVNDFIGRDDSPRKKRSALLVAGLAALGRLDAGAASRLNGRYGLDIQRASGWTQMIDGAARRNQPGSVLVLAASGLQAADFDAVPSSHIFHIVMALRNSGQEFLARMVAAEALSRT
ncbi:hypothetical protein H8M03_11860 [Sphingomonas sabuli]|uniref:Uncharacterized protein n=1 Tax=Sphingomonas sabuli TaxID=2764186 RepID=A0A7G9L227_9SPHN|nr:hypothetical protein [Sphingomonas sabuli]QNM82676.1 hypothetical protein H8M03_11860 [Sphingomonas sabuli]